MEKKYLHTVKDNIVKESYLVLNQTIDQNKCFFSGGMSIQLFLPEHVHRVSSDLDLNGPSKLSNEDFKHLMNKALSKLKNKGYVYEFKKQHYTFDVNLENDAELLVIQFPRRSESNFRATKKTLERELENVESVNYNGINMNVISTEDIILHKLLRIDMFKKLYDCAPIDEYDLCLIKSKLTIHKKEFQLNAYNLSPLEISKKVADIRLAADVYDIVALSIYKGLDKNYFNEAIKSFTSLNYKKTQFYDYFQKINPNAFNRSK